MHGATIHARRHMYKDVIHSRNVKSGSRLCAHAADAGQLTDVPPLQGHYLHSSMAYEGQTAAHWPIYMQ